MKEPLQVAVYDEVRVADIFVHAQVWDCYPTYQFCPSPFNVTYIVDPCLTWMPSMARAPSVSNNSTAAWRP